MLHTSGEWYQLTLSQKDFPYSLPLPSFLSIENASQPTCWAWPHDLLWSMHMSRHYAYHVPTEALNVISFSSPSTWLPSTQSLFLVWHFLSPYGYISIFPNNNVSCMIAGIFVLSLPYLQELKQFLARNITQY